MSINRVPLSQTTSQPIWNSEEKVYFIKEKVELEFKTNNTYPSNVNSNLYSKQGNLFITNLRVVYVTQPQSPFFATFEFPLSNGSNVQYIQPWFQANRVEVDVRRVLAHSSPTNRTPTHTGRLIDADASQPDLPDDGVALLTFNAGGAFEAYTYIKQLQSSLEETPQYALEEHLPAYSLPPPDYE